LSQENVITSYARFYTYILEGFKIRPF